MEEIFLLRICFELSFGLCLKHCREHNVAGSVTVLSFETKLLHGGASDHKKKIFIVRFFSRDRVLSYDHGVTKHKIQNGRVISHLPDYDPQSRAGYQTGNARISKHIQAVRKIVRRDHQ